MSPRPARYVNRRVEIQRQLQEIDELVLLADEQDEPLLRNALARLAVVRLSGFIEKALEHMITGYLEENSSGRVLSFGRSQAARISNLNPDKLETLVGRFDDDWRDALHDFLSEDERRQALGNLIGARHLLAHGGHQTVSMLLLEQYHSVAEATVKLLMDFFLPLPGRA